MIIPALITTDVDLTTLLPGAKDTDVAQDFLALVAEALGTEKTVLSAEEQPLPKGVPAKLTENVLELLPDEMADKLSVLSSLTNTLPAPLKSSTPLTAPQLFRPGEKAAETESTDDDVAALSALFAMLPGTSPVAVTSGESADTVQTAQNNAELTQSVNVRAALADKPQNESAGEALTVPLATPVNNTQPDNVPHSPVANPLPLNAGDNVAAPQPTATVMMTSSSTPQPLSPASSPAPVVSAPLGSHEWQQAISQHITLFTRQGQQRAELRLHPEDLGQVQISLKIDDNQAQIQMVSAHSHVRAALEAALPVLRTQLAESGIQLGQSNISGESFNGQQHASSQQPQHARTPQAGLSAEDEVTLAVPASLTRVGHGDGAVDIFA